ncbi:VOC family protein [Modestobacter sp. VKM Ac-2985]|uniref:VOC family protein n=1 Tax=Modestobacter sp. VKM Ac-2985 TaxID=3004139 RepID=UPI0022AB87E1|nr:VOC family protein [Modestobacter sp. VKM Ac-2985]MCZ2836110.1 VOC family protein [Modestobacter sp. VKM Ac-2985]
MPTRTTPWPAGTPCWVDLGTPEPDAARAFYTAVLDWTYRDPSPGSDGHRMCLEDGQEVAGLGPLQDPAGPSRWTTYFATDDADATAARVAAAGGRVLAPPRQAGPAGRMAIVTDPQGSPFGLWQAGATIGVELFNEPGALVWNEAAVDDPAAAQEFYTAVFGFAWEEVPDAGGYCTFATGDGPLGGLSGVVEGLPRGWSTCFAVADTDAAVGAVESGGGKVLMPAEDTPFGRFAVVTDPWGAVFSVMEVAEE